MVGGFRVQPEDSNSFEISVVVINSAEVINVDALTEIAGQGASEADQLGTAARGTFSVTLAVEPDELTDLTFAMEFGDITLAVAIPGVDNDDTPKAVTTLIQTLGDDGVWLEEFENGNVVELLSILFADRVSDEGDSVEFVLPSGSEDDDDDDGTILIDDEEDQAIPGGDGESEEDQAPPEEEEPAPESEETDAGDDAETEGDS